MTEYNGTGTAIVTGSAQGLGKAIAIRFARDGFDIVLNDLPIQREKLCQIQRQIAVSYPDVRCTNFTGDISKEADVQAMIEKAVAEHGGIDVVCPPLRISCV
jgi:NAD(P)-dependent dehydrogenase (short-subunit alcohol dehydrogenase family)